MTRRAPPSSSFTSRWEYDVFINFRGEDTRHGFTGNLYSALRQRGIRTFVDDEELRRGEEISPALLKAIQESRIAILVFSQNYASSTFCLIELVQILDHLHGQGRLVLPVFYDVDPSDVRHQRGNYAQALAEHAERSKDAKKKVQHWKLALHQAANLSGWHFKHGDEYEYKFIGKIVKEVSNKIDRKFLYIAEYPVGLEARVTEVKSLIGVGFIDRVNMIGIYGIGGSGKSTIARALYNLIADQFECVCFLADIREKSLKLGLEQLQETLFSELVMEDIKLGDVNQGIPILKRRLHEKKVLLILDDVDEIEQLRALAGARDWFGLGSTIIITARDKYLLNIHGVDKKYEVQQLNHTEALELLSWNAFQSNEVDPNYMDILNSVAYYARGLPLALEVIGSNLFGKSLNEWKSALDRYKRIPNEKVHQILKVSFDCLEEDQQKIFLDIASFYRGKNLEYVMDMVQCTWDFDPRYGIEYGIGVLIDKSLIKIINGFVTMHDLIQDMGIEIVRQESPEEPGKRSRLWSIEDIIHVLEENTGSDKIKAIIQNPLFEVMKVNWDGKAFKKMKNLRVLIIENARFSKGPKYLPNCLKVIKWQGYPSMSLPSDFHPRKLVILQLQHSCLKSLEPIKNSENLSDLNLSSCQFITQIPDLSGLSNLRELKLDRCQNLVEIHDSIGYLEKLETLSATNCAKLRIFPRAIKLHNLRNLELSGCSRLKIFPEILEKMEYITWLDLSKTNLELPFSIRNLTELSSLDMDNCGRIQLPSNIGLLPKLKDINIQSCGELQLSKPDERQEKFNPMDYSKLDLLLRESNISDETLPICLTLFANVEYLDLSDNNFTILPACIKECYHLQSLRLHDCIHLKDIRGIPPNIQDLWAINCTSLSLESTNMLLNQKLHEVGDKWFLVPGASIPKWCDHYNNGPSITFWFRNNFPRICLYFVVTSRVEVESNSCLHLFINGKEMLTINPLGKSEEWYPLLGDHILCVNERSIFKSRELNLVLLQSEWNYVEVRMCSNANNCVKQDDEFISLKIDYEFISVKEIGMNIMKQGNRREDIQFVNPYKKEKLDALNWDSSFGVLTSYEVLSSDSKEKDVNNTKWLTLPSCKQTPLDDGNRTSFSLVHASDTTNSNKEERSHGCLAEAKLEGGIYALGSINTEFDSYFKQRAEDELKKSNANPSSSHGVFSSPAKSIKLYEVPHVGKGKAGSSIVVDAFDNMSILLNKNKMLRPQPELFLYTAAGTVLSSNSEENDIYNSECLALPSGWQTPLDDENRTPLVYARDTISTNQEERFCGCLAKTELEGGIHALGSINIEFDSYFKQCAKDELKKSNANPSSSCGVVSSPAESIKLSEVSHVGKGKAGGSVVVAGSDDRSILLNEDKMLELQLELFFHTSTGIVLCSNSEEMDVSNRECLTLPSCKQTPLDDENMTLFSLVHASDTISSNQEERLDGCLAEAELEGNIHALRSIYTKFGSYCKQRAEDEFKNSNANPSSNRDVVSSPAESIKLYEVPHVGKGKAGGSVVVAGSDDRSILLNEDKMLQPQPELLFLTAARIDLQQQQNLTSISQEILKSSISQPISKGFKNIRIAKRKRKNTIACRDNTDEEKDINTLEDPVKSEYQMAHQNGQPVSDDQSTKRDKNHGGMRSQQRRYRWYLISLVVLCPYVLLLLWLLHDFSVTWENEIAPPT